MEVKANLNAIAWKRSFIWELPHKPGTSMKRNDALAKSQLLKDLTSGPGKYDFRIRDFTSYRVAVPGTRKSYHNYLFVVSSDAFLPQNIMTWGNSDGREFSKEDYNRYLEGHKIDFSEEKGRNNR